MASRRQFGRDFKLDAIRRLENGARLRDVAGACGVDVNVLRRWKRDYERARETAFPGPGRPPRQTGIADLRRRIEEHTRQIEHLLTCVRNEAIALTEPAPPKILLKDSSRKVRGAHPVIQSPPAIRLTDA